MTPIIDKSAADYVGWRECKWRKQLDFNRDCRHAAIPRKYDGRTFRDYTVTNDNERAIRIAKEYVRDMPPKSLFYFGGTGTGKTFLAAIIAKEFIKSGKTVIFGDVPDLLEELKRTFDDKTTSTQQEILDRYCECDLLIMDDLGAGHMKSWSLGVIYQIINRRDKENKPLIVTTNFDGLKGLEEKLGDIDETAAKRITSRLAGMCIQVFFGEEDRRWKN